MITGTQAPLARGEPPGGGCQALAGGAVTTASKLADLAHRMKPFQQLRGPYLRVTATWISV
jgi:hypothetical protein